MRTQYDRVLAVLKATKKPLSLFEIKAAILARFERMDSEAGISARIRDIRHDLERGSTGTVHAMREQGKAWYRYCVLPGQGGGGSIDSDQFGSLTC